MADNMAGRHLLEIELQAARQYGNGNLLRVGGCQNELDVLGRFFQRLQHRVEGVVGEHVNFVDHIDLEARIRGRVHGLLQQLRHFIHAAVGRRIHFDVIDKAPGIDGHAGIAHTAGMGGDAGHTVKRLGQYARQRGLADPARAGEQIGMMQALLFERMRQGAHDVLLPYQRFEALGAVFTGQYLIGHAYAEM